MNNIQSPIFECNKTAGGQATYCARSAPRPLRPRGFLVRSTMD